ncbi:MAG TPA: hypothetical protein VK530_11815 [Candidatus Acidoferrum sp.]|nr:hypothetical protein [Candidatus Acidoferrum sp.]
MSATEATAEVFVTAFKSLKPQEREAVLTSMLADTLTLESRRNQPRESFRLALKEIGIKA